MNTPLYDKKRMMILVSYRLGEKRRKILRDFFDNYQYDTIMSWNDWTRAFTKYMKEREDA